jgi:hypothetical protein
MNAGTKIIVITVVSVLVVAFVFFFIPLVGVEATPPNWQYYATTTTIQGSQTRTMTLVRNPPVVGSTASLAFCFLGHGALFQNGTYYIYTSSHVQVLGSFCPTPQ